MTSNSIPPFLFPNLTRELQSTSTRDGEVQEGRGSEIDLFRKQGKVPALPIALQHAVLPIHFPLMCALWSVRLARVDLTSEETEPVIQEFLRLLKESNVEVLDHHEEGTRVSLAMDWTNLPKDRSIDRYRSLRGQSGGNCGRGTRQEGSARVQTQGEET